MKYAILIQNTSFPQCGDMLLPVKTNPEGMAKLRATLNQMPQGNFTVRDVFNSGANEIRLRLAQDFARATPEDFVFIYYSGRFVENNGQVLGLAAIDTQYDAGNFIPFSYVSIAEIEFLIATSKTRRVFILADTDSSPQADDAIRTFLTTSGYEKLALPIDQKQSAEPDGAGIYFMTVSGSLKPASAPRHGMITTSFSHILAERRQEKHLTVLSIFQWLEQELVKLGLSAALFAKDRKGDMLVRDTLLPYSSAGDAVPWKRLSPEQNACLVGLCPVYILDPKFHFLDWNPAFEHIIARQYGLVRGQYAAAFLQKLENWDAIHARSIATFREPDDDEQARCDQNGTIPSSFPLVDNEPFEFLSDVFRLIVFEKLASQICEDDGLCKSWSVMLNVTFIQHRQGFFETIKSLFESHAIWSRYADVYDEIIGGYAEYKKLVATVAGKISRSAVNVLDIGAATGNATSQLLKDAPKRRVTAIELSEEMLRRMYPKLNTVDNRGRFALYKGDALSILRNFALQIEQISPRDRKVKMFDGCVLLNVLFTLDNPVDYLTAIYNVLSPNSDLSIATPRKGTNVEYLFEQIQKFYEDTNEWPSKQESFDRAHARNRDLIPAATKDTVETIKGYVTSAGFEIVDVVDDVYDKCVVVIHARKPEMFAARRSE